MYINEKYIIHSGKHSQNVLTSVLVEMRSYKDGDSGLCDFDVVWGGFRVEGTEALSG